ncbi:helix-turn-helix domain-containing protein [Kordiimonas sp.]|uniref:helix-turn-helix domain-containing protein n=1 Tax=Kordiimonas sp. TaxID=1970157 RepID=UPI003A936694
MAGTVRSAPYQRLLKALVELRKSRGLSQSDLAERLGKPPSFVGKFELGERRLDVVEAFIILRALDAQPAAVLEDVLVELPDKL